MKNWLFAASLAFGLTVSPYSAHAGGTHAIAVGWSTAAAQSDGMPMSKVADVMRGQGFDVQFGENGSGEPVIYSEAAGLNFALFGFNCAGSDAPCNEFLLSTYFDLDTPPPLEAINAFNEKTLAGRAFLDEEGDPNLEHLFSVTSADDTALIERNLEIWESVMVDFANHLDSLDGSSS